MNTNRLFFVGNEKADLGRKKPLNRPQARQQYTNKRFRGVSQADSTPFHHVFTDVGWPISPNTKCGEKDTLASGKRSLLICQAGGCDMCAVDAVVADRTHPLVSPVPMFLHASSLHAERRSLGLAKYIK
jgi:hypothetical protein